MEFFVRPYKATDAEQVKKCVQELNTYESQFDADYVAAEESAKAAFAHILEERKKGGEIFVVEGRDAQTHTVVGFIALALDNKNDERFVGKVPAVFIDSMLVLEDYRGSGIGKILLEKSFDFARAKHIKYVTLDVYADNNRARELYESAGFKSAEIRMSKAVQ